MTHTIGKQLEIYFLHSPTSSLW